MEHSVIITIKKTIAEHSLIENGMQVVVGLSGGPDSLCLFHVLASLRGELGFGLAAAHVNHGLRPGAAERDARIAEDFCRAQGAPFFYFARDVRALARARGMSEEEAGRAARYEAFREAAAQTAAENAMPPARVRIAVAHNGNDQAETVLLRILRGTGTDGLAAIPYRREGEGGFAVIRPLLDVPRSAVEAYCAAAGLEPARDHSNEEIVCTRNRVRLALLPELEKNYNKNIVRALARLAASAAEDRDCFDRITEELLKQVNPLPDGGLEAPLSLFSDAHPALRHRLIVRCFERAGLAQDIAAVHLRAAYALIASGRSGKRVDFPNGYRLSLRYGRLHFLAAEEKPRARAVPAEQVLPLGLLLDNLDKRGPKKSAAAAVSSREDARAIRMEAGDYTVRFSLHSACCVCGTPQTGEMSAAAEPQTGAAEQGAAGIPADAAEPDAAGAGPLLLDFDLLAAAHDEIGVRSRRAGDLLRPAGMDGAKRIQDLFVDAKLPRESRDLTPLVAAGNEILCVLAPGRLGRKTGNYAVTPATRRILCIVCEKR
jgi:tRNA(Ile)-lysidine synthase